MKGPGSPASQLHLLTRLRNLTSLSIDAADSLPQSFIDDALPTLQVLEQLDLRRVGTNVTTLAALAGLSRLRTLTVSDAPNLATLGGLSFCRALEEVNVDVSKIDRLVSLPAARSIQLDKTLITEASMTQLPSLPRLTSLRLGTVLVNEEKRHWWPTVMARRLPRLTDLCLEPVDAQYAVALLSLMPRLKLVLTADLVGEDALPHTFLSRILHERDNRMNRRR